MMNVGIIGCGYFGGLHGEVLARMDQIKVLAASRRDEKALGEFTQRFGIRGYRDWQELLEDRDIDTVLIASPHFTHAGIAVEAARRGLNILMEKPMAINLEECGRIARAVRENNVSFMVDYSCHYFPSYIKARQIIAEGGLGRVVGGHSTMQKFWMEQNRRDWHLDRSRGGGMWLTAGIHAIDRLTWLTGKKIRAVSAHFASEFHDQEADDFGMVFLRYSDAVTGTVQSVAYREGYPVNETQVIGTRGILRIRNGELSLARHGEWTSVMEDDPAEAVQLSLRKSWEEFLLFPGDSGRRESELEYSLHLMNAVFGAERSSLLNKEIAIPGK